MKNKNIILLVGFILLSIIAYQAYLLYNLEHKKDGYNQTSIKPKSLDHNFKPEIVVNLNSNNHKKDTKSIQNITPQEQAKLDQEKIQKSLQDLLKSIFGSKEVQDSLKEFKIQAEVGFKELQKELLNLPKELEALSSQVKDDPILSQFFNNISQLKNIEGDIFEDRGDHYYITFPLQNAKNSKINITTNDHYLVVEITKKSSKTVTKDNTTISTNSSSIKKHIVAIPQDALIEKLQTSYKNGILEITVPKVKASSKT